jgi:hypothetical protein
MVGGYVWVLLRLVVMRNNKLYVNSVNNATSI